MKRKIYISLAGLAVLGLIFGIYLGLTDVDTAVTATDRKYIKKILKLKQIDPRPKNQKFAQQLAFISTVQDSVLKAIPHEGRVPFGQPREPKNIYAHGSGLCYDRSRLIEKSLQAHGYEVVHLSIYFTHKRSAPLALITPGNPSHAITAVKTKKGWLIVDSNRRWLNVTENLRLVPLDRLSQTRGTEGLSINWHPKYAEKYENKIVTKPFVAVLGLYSRHGLFYPPFDRIPDVDWPDFSYNLLGLN